jgi:aminobenzoyl-glutamate transport protein
VKDGGLLNLIERIGNKLPDPNTLFLLGTVLVILASSLAVAIDMRVEQRLPKQVLAADGSESVEWQATGEVFTAKSLLSREGIYWLLKNLVKNFVEFPPLGVVLVGMLGIGVAERCGLIAALLKSFLAIVPARLLTPAMVFLGIMSSMTLDAGYVVLPPLAAAVYVTAGRSPLAGIAAVFAGVAAGFNANLFITGLEPVLSQFATLGANVLDPNYQVNPACNWWFMIASTFVITLAGWWVSAKLVEPRLPVTPTEAAESADRRLSPAERKGLALAGGVFGIVAILVTLGILVPGAPLHTFVMDGGIAEQVNGELVASDAKFARWVYAIVPLLFFAFIVPAIAYGLAAGSITSDRDVARMLTESMAAMAPILVLAFFAAQFIACFQYSGLDKMLAMAGGQALGHIQLPSVLLMLAFIGLTMLFNLFIGSMSAKYAMFAPIFIPMFMMVGISPELTQAAYRIGDSVTNCVTPLNPYLIIILVFMKQYAPKSGMGTLIAMMLPYTIVFAIVWGIMLTLWMLLGIPLGPDGALEYVPLGS